MLDRIELRNFKSAMDLELPLRPLNLLAGLNGSGKSTVLQAIALLKQSLEQSSTNPSLLLRGDLINLGRSEDIHYESATEESLTIAIRVDGELTTFTAAAVEGADTLTLKIDGDGSLVKEALDKWFQFIQADRLTPANRYEQATTRDRERGWLGCRGQFTVDFLKRNESLVVSGRRLFGNTRATTTVDPRVLSQVAPTTRLLDQTAAWLQLVSPGVRLRPADLDIADLSTLRFQFTGAEIGSETRDFRPGNVGFGLTYSLPIVVACLAAPTGALLLLENPEAHLHPRGQAALGELLASVAADGVQVIVETHSDHVLNGVRLAVKRRSIDSEDVALNYFERDVETGATSRETPRILPDGQLDRWPAGFFDQWDRSLDQLLD